MTPAGYRAPFWELNWHTPGLLADRGFVYDSSLTNADYPPLQEAGPISVLHRHGLQ